MFSCKACTQNPFNLLFGLPTGESNGAVTPAARSANRTPQQQTQSQPQQQSKQAGADTSAGQQQQQRGAKNTPVNTGGVNPNGPNPSPRTEEDVKDLIAQWQQYAHPRAREFFQEPEAMARVLLELAKGVSKGNDPILGTDTCCVQWYGDVTTDDSQAAIRMTKPGEDSESITYVNRVLAFIFATDDCFEALMQLPKEPFKMQCGCQLCVNLAHIAMEI
mmetsp:Transcript_30128/g.65108  ORF Transcript_30128/g.65108 Transcript_30128/m.65108 type:complete len:219 (-) Transcript_30128:66-722(-)|eukprot:CAMPEP_0206450520 /NCGR_PEP_ID=MMETSP0324_2-20121206/18776_1 /ASSEMBLY_ACC=CAM_ASM_000836 /TAXON_ID=2866 /ORGANISM="Crypthecodinium cohnii, Strain Seligo" /LENGTH=218 /DNA_ID=CAMNT_0053920189 /DNA_START=164 /DNA_END=820 /DNA_ORIENTATION=-